MTQRQLTDEQVFSFVRLLSTKDDEYTHNKMNDIQKIIDEMGMGKFCKPTTLNFGRTAAICLPPLDSEENSQTAYITFVQKNFLDNDEYNEKQYRILVEPAECERCGYSLTSYELKSPLDMIKAAIDWLNHEFSCYGSAKYLLRNAWGCLQSMKQRNYPPTHETLQMFQVEIDLITALIHMEH